MVMEWLALAVALLAVVTVVATCPVEGVGRFIAPDSLAVFVLAAIFGIRPVLKATMASTIQASGKLPWHLYGHPISQDGWDTAVWVGIVALLAYTVGATGLTCSGVRGSRRLTQRDIRRRTRQGDQWSFGAMACVVTALAGTGLYFGVIAVLAGSQAVVTLFGGRSADTTLPGLPEAVAIAGLSGSLAAAILMISRRERKLLPPHWAAIAFAILLSVIQVSLGGNRRFLIPAVLIPMIAWLIRRPRRITLPWVAVGIAGGVFLSVVPMVRSAGARLPGENLFTASWRYVAEEGVLGSLLPVFTSYDTEMIDYIAVVAPTLGGSQPLGWGRGTVLEFLTRPAPSGALSGEVSGQSFSDTVLTSVWGGGCADAVCPVASVAGVSYFDGGMVGVVIGCLLFGAALRCLSSLWNRAEELTDSAVLAVVVLSSFGLIAARTNTVHATWWALYALIIALVAFWLLRTPVIARPVPPGWSGSRRRSGSDSPPAATSQT